MYTGEKYEKSYLEIKYKRYLEEGIPIVIATDGHGLYGTHVVVEDAIAQSQLGEDFDVVLATDEYMISKKVGR